MSSTGYCKETSYWYVPCNWLSSCLFRLAQRLSPSVVQAFVYMWHPWAIDTFDSYFGSLNSFSDSQEDDSWETTVTLVYWAIASPTTYVLDPESTSSPKSKYTEPRQGGKFPPSNVHILQRLQDKGNEGIEHNIQGYIEERSSALVITGDSQGYLWTCSVWSSLIDEEEFDWHLPKMREVLNPFKHQQSIGRSLIFLYILGLLCEKLSSELEETLKSCENYLELGVSQSIRMMEERQNTDCPLL